MNSFKFLRSKVFVGVAAFLLGAIVVLGIRVAAYQAPAGVHYHANFAVYINGQREQFRPLYYYEGEAATACAVSEESETTPMSRVHMHGNVNDVVHVEDSRVTWGNFFTVLGWNIGNNYLATRDTVYQANDQNQVTYILNGKKVNDIVNTIIGDQDKLLVNYGSQSTQQLNQEYGQIQNNALKADQSPDPAGCGGAHKDTVTMSERMHHMFR